MAQYLKINQNHIWSDIENIVWPTNSTIMRKRSFYLLRAHIIVNSMIQNELVKTIQALNLRSALNNGSTNRTEDNKRECETNLK